MNNQLPIAFHILGFLASQHGESVTSDILADTYGTSPVVLRRVLAKLQRAGLVDTKRGVHGGSVLARDPGAINLREAYTAVLGDAQVLQRPSDGCAGAIASALARFVDDVMGDAEQALLDRLQAVTVAEMDTRVRANIGDIVRATPT